MTKYDFSRKFWKLKLQFMSAKLRYNCLKYIHLIKLIISDNVRKNFEFDFLMTVHRDKFL